MKSWHLGHVVVPALEDRSHPPPQVQVHQPKQKSMVKLK